MMGVHSTGREGRVAMYDSVTGIAFGPTFETQDELEAFELYCYPHDLRKFSSEGLAALLAQWQEVRAAAKD